MSAATDVRDRYASVDAISIAGHKVFPARATGAHALSVPYDSADASYVAKAKSAFYHDVNDAAFAAIANLLTPDEPLQVLTTPTNLTVARWGSVPRAYIRCTGDRAIPIVAQDKMITEADAFTPRQQIHAKNARDQPLAIRFGAGGTGGGIDFHGLGVPEISHRSYSDFQWSE